MRDIGWIVTMAFMGGFGLTALLFIIGMFWIHIIEPIIHSSRGKAK